MIDWLIDFWGFNATFNNISAVSWRPVLMVEEAGVPERTMDKQLVNFITCGSELSAPFLARLAFRPCELFSSLFVRRPSVNISHFILLLRNHWANCNQTLVAWTLDGPLPKLCPVIPTSNQDGRQDKNRKKGGWNFNWPLLL